MTIWIVALGVLAVIIGMLKVKGKCSVSSLKKDTREEDIYEPWKRLAQKYPDVVEAYPKVGLIDHEYKQDDAKAEEPKKKPKPRARKPRKNKKTQGKS